MFAERSTFSKKSSVLKILLELSSYLSIYLSVRRLQFSMLCSALLFSAVFYQVLSVLILMVFPSASGKPSTGVSCKFRYATLLTVLIVIRRLTGFRYTFSFGALTICQIVSGVINLLWTSGISNRKSRLLIVGLLTVTYCRVIASMLPAISLVEQEN